MRRHVGIICTLVLLTGFFAPVSAGERIPIPKGVFYHQPAADAFGLDAAWNNPAELARYKARSAQVMADYFDGSFGRSWGFAVGGERITTAYRYLDLPGQGIFKEWIWAGGFSLTANLQAGVSYRYFSDGPGIYNNRHFWNIGLAGRYGSTIRWAAVFSNLNRGHVAGERTETEMRYSLAWQPFGPKTTVAADMLLSTGTSVSNADWRYQVEYTPTTGLYLYGGLDSDDTFTVGFRTNLIQYFIGSRSRFTDDGDGRGTTAYAGVTEKRQPSVIPQPRRRLQLSISGRPSENPVRPVFGSNPTAYATMLMGVYRAADDVSVSEMVLDLKRLRLGFGQAQELTAAVRYFRDRGKTVTCYITDPNNIAYYVAASCDRIYIPPVSRVRLVGLRAELKYFAGTFEKIGVDIELLRIGEYKTAPERYTRKSSTEEHRAELNRILDEQYDMFVDGIARGRGFPADSVKQLIDQGPLTSVEALEAGLVDGLVYRDQLVGEYLDGMPQIGFKSYQSDTLMNDSWVRRPKLAVVVAEGDIAEQSRQTPFLPAGDVTPGLMSRALAQARSADDIEGIVLRVNSPGGEALAGEQIYHSATRTAEKKPMVVSMANVAASGGYHVSMAGHRLFANPATITGSIGIYGGKADLSGLFEKIDLTTELYTRGRFAGMLTYTRPFTDAEREKYMHLLRSFYSYFLEVVGENRDLTVDSVDVLGRGKVFTGREAVRHGLVDELGGLKESLDYTAESLGIDDYDIVIYPQKRPLFVLPGQSLFGAIASLFGGDDDTGEDIVDRLVPEDVGTLLLARMPYDLTIE
ncbi:signal peptide peptidase SppA [candidate division GN15 bacterium]|nr:signal peptide peptidase SppA [candidate division GN15 bacterium]